MLQLCLQPYKTNIVYKPEQTRVPPATELQEVNNATAAEETLQGLSSKIDSNSKVARGWKKMSATELVPTGQTGAISIKWRNSERNLHNSS